jgi:hypothetical protein
MELARYLSPIAVRIFVGSFVEGFVFLHALDPGCFRKFSRRRKTSVFCKYGFDVRHGFGS